MNAIEEFKTEIFDTIYLYQDENYKEWNAFEKPVGKRFETIFKEQLNKKGSGATKKWAQSVLSKLEKLDGDHDKDSGDIRIRLEDFKEIFSTPKSGMFSKNAAINDEKVTRKLKELVERAETNRAFIKGKSGNRTWNKRQLTNIEGYKGHS